jgi:hypothetical protein
LLKERSGFKSFTKVLPRTTFSSRMEMGVEVDAGIIVLR